mmetsp:Transcript_49141/g.117055  ORF Transcript_49141/g.117055 Transcript_49141/m.117055 type:complete len:201 (-) Transcript_49141:735-1337(-)
MQTEAVDIDGAVHNTDLLPMLDVVLPAHPEGAIVPVFIAHRLLDSGVLSPQVALVAPISIPLSVPPWVSDLHEPEGGSSHHAEHACVHFLHLQYAVSMPRMQPIGAVGGRCAQHTPEAVVLQQDLKHGVMVNDLANLLEAARTLVLRVVLVEEIETGPILLVVVLNEPPCRIAGHGPYSPNRDATLDVAKAAAEFCKCLL